MLRGPARRAGGADRIRQQLEGPVSGFRSAVVRAGGLPRSRYVLPTQAGAAQLPVQLALAQARVSQLNEQINTLPALTNLVPAFAFLPPKAQCPPLPWTSTKRWGAWFLQLAGIEVGPIHQEEIETALCCPP